MAEWLIPIATILTSVIVALIGASVSWRALNEQRRVHREDEARRSADRLKVLTEKDRLEQEITELVLSRAKIQLDEMQAQIDELKRENAQLKANYYDLDKRYNVLKKDYDKVLRENGELRARVKDLENKTDTGPLKEH